jgi:type I restriction enzyme S subunit
VAGRNVAFVNTIPGRCALSVNDPNSPAPPGWAWVKLTDLARLESGHTPSRNHPEYWEGDIAWIGIKDAREHHAGVIHDTLQHVTQAGIDNSAARLLPANTVCLSRTASVGYVVVMGRPMATSQDFVNWVCTPALDPDYLKWLLLAEGEDGLRKFGKGSTHTTIYFPEVQAFHACVAPINEQRRIVAKLDAIFEKTRAAKARLERLPTLLEKLKRSILAAAFRGDLTKDWRAAHPNVEPASVLLERIRVERRRRWEDAQRAKGKHPKKTTYEEAAPPEVSELADLPPGWTWASIDEMATVFQYGSSAKTRDQVEVPVIRMGNIVDGQLVYDGFKYLPLDHDEFPDLFLQPGDLLFNRTNSPELVGKSAVYDGRVTPCSFASYLIRVRFHLVDARWVSHYLNSGAGRDWVRGVVAQQVGQANVNGTKLKAFAIPVPPADEVAAALHLIEAALASARALDDRVDAVLNELAEV